ncbi:MAG: hypothetical protein HUK01_03220 [Bacteroidaceae bacterium]|nr:hypothetical protein [Bacteroidaceae bacterium]
MKNIYIKVLLGMAVVLLASCRVHNPVAQESGKEDMGYLLFVSVGNNDNYDLDVTLDDKTFKARTVKAKKAGRRGTQYGITPGVHTIKVMSEGKLYYEKKIMVSAQEVKQIELP